MGAICSCFGRSSFETFPKEDLNDHNNGLLITANTEILKQRCSQRKNEIKRRELNPQEKQKKKQQQQLVKDKEFTTLKDCLLSSPAVDTYYNSSTNGDDPLVYCHVILKQNKVYPSFAEDNVDYASNPRGSFSKKRLLKISEVNSSSQVDVSSSLTRNHSKKIKKRVSFKLPEESDIFIYHIPEEEI
ncbi:conserved hypothetical protein [Ricinus communis]|uniref:Uncharacterized protein n=1 Tax=Ricinus communis TaxID=3988 RepID=B9SYY4_RICCO|nr:conserved hypothetical protein [Ricinus communis]